jgi:hypothetical protein
MKAENQEPKKKSKTWPKKQKLIAVRKKKCVAPQTEKAFPSDKLQNRLGYTPNSPG